MKTFFTVLALIAALIFTSIPINAASYTETPSHEYEILTSTLSGAVGMQGFEGAYALPDDPHETVEIIVQFVTPPSVALQLLHDFNFDFNRLHSVTGWSARDSYEEQALFAHAEFHRQMRRIPVPFGVHAPEIFSEHHTLFNGVYMRVPADMVESIAELPEVFGVFPNVAFEPLYEPATAPGVINPAMLAEARQLFNTNHIHNEMDLIGRGVRVAVIDTGIDHSHPEFERFLVNGRVPGYDFYENPNDSHGHGTAVSGAVIAIAPGVELYSYRVGLTGTTGGTTTAAVERAREDGVHVLNMSFGSAAINHPFAPFAYTVSLAVLDGMIVVAAAGNSGSGSFTVSSPAAAPLAIAVGSGTAGGSSGSDSIAVSSSRGPVGQTHHIKPDIVAPGVSIFTSILGGGYGPSSGTSMASPIVAGVVALMLEKFPDATPDEIRARLMNTARPLEVSVANRVFTAGAGFMRPIEALTAEEIVTVRQEVPTHNNPNMPFTTQSMASLSFGAVNVFEGETLNKSLTVQIENAGAAARDFTISHEFLNNPGGAASVNFSESITVQPGGAGQFDVNMAIGAGAPLGTYEGFILVSEGARTVARLPFAAVVTETAFASASSEQALRAAVSTANLSGVPTVITLENDITLNNTSLSVSGNITLRSTGETAHTITADGNFNVISVTAGMLVLDGVNITRRNGTTGRGITNSGHFTLADGIISGHTFATNGGGVLNQPAGVFVMLGGKISGNTAGTTGGGVFNFGIFDMQAGEISGNTANSGGGIGMNTSDLITPGRLLIGADAVFAENAARTANPVNRNPAHDEIYRNQILGTRWTDPFIQGFNNFDINSGGFIATIRNLSFELNSTPENPTNPATIAPIRVIANSPMLQAPRLPAVPTRASYIFEGWYRDSNFTQPVTEAMLMPNANITIFARWSMAPIIPGDVNGDQAVTQLDADTLREYLAGHDIPIIEANADLNGDGVVNIVDLTMLRLYLVGYIALQ